jgi:starch-binding outer membrane protein, SusD/RagB family
MQNKTEIRKYGSLISTILFILVISQLSCKKYLAEKPVQNLAVPSSLNDLQTLLNNTSINYGSPAYLEFVADNFYLTSTTLNSSTTTINERTSYIWDKAATVVDLAWTQPYSSIYDANFVLDFLPQIKINGSDQNNYNQIKGQALFYRSFYLYQVAQLFCKPYSASASTDPGIVLRLTSAVEVPSTRATVQQTYDQVISDLKTAVDLLPITNVIKTFPTKAAAYGALARVYLSMRDYVNAGVYANASLNLNNNLLDYNQLSGTLPAFANNPEISFLSTEGGSPYDLLSPVNCRIDSILYQSYNVNDLRKTIFYGSNAGMPYWQGSYFNYSSTFTNFDGIATDEVYLIRAESKARAGNKDDAMSDLNTLLRKRWNNQFTDLTASDAVDALNKILIERRKELPFRGLRWTDLRRFNLEGANITLTRIINGTTYSLPPNDPRWVLLIPVIEISRSGIAQNPR